VTLVSIEAQMSVASEQYRFSRYHSKQWDECHSHHFR